MSTGFPQTSASASTSPTATATATSTSTSSSATATSKLAPALPPLNTLVPNPLSSSTSGNANANDNNQPPQISLTPATPNTPFNDINNTGVAQQLPIPSAASSGPASSDRTESEPREMASKEIPGAGVEGDRIGGQHTTNPNATANAAVISPSTAASTAVLSEKSNEKEKENVPIATASKPTPTVNKPTSTPAQTQTQTQTQAQTSRNSASTPKKRRKRKGLAGFLLSLGCLSADEFEDDPKKAKAKPATTTTKPAADTAPKAGVVKVPTSAPATASPPVTSTSATTPGSQPATNSATKAAAGVAVLAPAALATAAVASSESETSKGASLPLAGAPDAATGSSRDGGAGAGAAEVVVAPVEPVTMPRDETAGLTSAAVQAPGSGPVHITPTKVQRSGSASTPSEAHPTTSSSEPAQTETSGGYSNISSSDTDGQYQDENHQDQDHDNEHDGEGEGDEYDQEQDMDDYEDEEDRLIAQGGIGIPVDEHGNPAPLLPEIAKVHLGRKCLVLDLDETLLHSSFKMLPSADYIVPVEIEGQTHNVYVIKRPGVDHFLTEMGKIYEVVVFTASLSKYADPVLDMLDPAGVVKHRLFRESCYNHKGNYVKDLSQLGRTMETSIIIDNSPASYIFHPNNAVPVSTWFNDPHDTELTDLCPFLADLAEVEDVRGVLDGGLL